MARRILMLHMRSYCAAPGQQAAQQNREETAHHIGVLNMRAHHRLVQGIELGGAAALMAQHLHGNGAAPPAACMRRIIWAIRKV